MVNPSLFITPKDKSYNLSIKYKFSTSVATTTTNTILQPSTRPWPPPPVHHLSSHTTHPPDHHHHHSPPLSSVMLGLLISQPNSSQHYHPPPPPPPSITHHHNRNDDDGGDDGDDDGSDVDGSLKVCKDCGNRAKKECSFRRCRTCCKTRGFDCATHERSTWIPASKRRDKKIGSGSGSCSSYGGVKRPRTFVPSPSSHINVTNSSSSANDFSLGLSSYTQDSSFKKCLPRRIEARAVFRNIRVTDVSDGEAENAYVATVNISGHVFRGLLYDHGTGTRDHNNNNNNNNNNNVFPCVTKLHMETSTSGGGRRNRDPSSMIVDPSNTNTLTAASSGDD